MTYGMEKSHFKGLTCAPECVILIEVSAGRNRKIMTRDGGELRVSPDGSPPRWHSRFPAAALNETGTASLTEFNA